jgi:hypothetical protein
VPQAKLPLCSDHDHPLIELLDFPDAEGRSSQTQLNLVFYYAFDERLDHFFAPLLIFIDPELFEIALEGDYQ